MARQGTVTVAGKPLACHHCGAQHFELRNHYLYAMQFFAGSAVAAMCTACHFVHTFRRQADLRVAPHPQ